MQYNRSMKTKELKRVLESAGEMGIKVLDKRVEGSSYVEALLLVLSVMKSVTPEEIKACGYPSNIESTIMMDRYLLDGTITEEHDCLSLLSTLVTYIEAFREGLPEHSKLYMDRVTDLRHVIDEVYGTKAMPFCGTGDC